MGRKAPKGVEMYVGQKASYEDCVYTCVGDSGVRGDIDKDRDS